MKLVKYLADYLDHEHVYVMYYGEAGDVDDLQELIQAGIEAFASTERKQVTVRDIPTDHLDELY